MNNQILLAHKLVSCGLSGIEYCSFALTHKVIYYYCRSQSDWAARCQFKGEITGYMVIFYDISVPLYMAPFPKIIAPVNSPFTPTPYKQKIDYILPTIGFHRAIKLAGSMLLYSFNYGDELYSEAAHYICGFLKIPCNIIVRMICAEITGRNTHCKTCNMWSQIFYDSGSKHSDMLDLNVVAEIMKKSENVGFMDYLRVDLKTGQNGNFLLTVPKKILLRNINHDLYLSVSLYPSHISYVAALFARECRVKFPTWIFTRLMDNYAENPSAPNLILLRGIMEAIIPVSRADYVTTFIRTVNDYPPEVRELIRIHF